MKATLIPCLVLMTTLPSTAGHAAARAPGAALPIKPGLYETGRAPCRRSDDGSSFVRMSAAGMDDGETLTRFVAVTPRTRSRFDVVESLGGQRSTVTYDILSPSLFSTTRHEGFDASGRMVRQEITTFFTLCAAGQVPAGVR